MIENIVKDLTSLLPEQLHEVHRVIQAYQSALKNRVVTEGGMHYLGRFIGIDWDERGRAFMQLGVSNENTYGVAQGGALFTLADVAIGFEILKKIKPNEKVFTLEMKMNFIKKGTGDKLFAKTEFLHMGRTTVVAQCTIQDQDDLTVAHALGTFYIVKSQ